ncbi:MAG: hypothetical protein ACI9LX_003954 [Paraglaciecola sp.]|jgi:hypothetical protein
MATAKFLSAAVGTLSGFSDYKGQQVLKWIGFQTLMTEQELLWCMPIRRRWKHYHKS